MSWVIKADSEVFEACKGCGDGYKPLSEPCMKCLQEKRINPTPKKEGTDKKAEEVVQEEEVQGPDIQEDDYVITTGGPLGSLYAVNKLGFSSPEMHEVMWAIAKDIEKTKFFPNIWFVNDHGNTDLLALDILDDDLTFRVVHSWV